MHPRFQQRPALAASAVHRSVGSFRSLICLYLDISLLMNHNGRAKGSSPRKQTRLLSGR